MRPPQRRSEHLRSATVAKTTTKKKKKKTAPAPKTKKKKAAASKKSSAAKTAGRGAASRKKPVKKSTKKTVKKTAKKTTTVKKKAKTASGKKTVKKKTVAKPASKPTAKQTKKPSGKATPPQTAAKKTAPKKAARPAHRARILIPQIPVPEPLTVEQLRKVKIDLTKRDLADFRSLLLKKRSEILGDVEAMQTDARTKSAGGNLSNMPVHMADVGSDNYEQEFTLGLVESERRLLREIEGALERMTEGIYGVCQERGVPISRPRLEAKPWAKYSIEVAREHERRGRV